MTSVAEIEVNRHASVHHRHYSARNPLIQKICATQRKLEANLLASKNHPSSQKKQLKRYKEKKQMIENWLSLLNDDELFVIQRHLIDEVIWSQLEEEYAARTGTFPKVRRTLMRYQNKALEKILRFLHEA